MRALIINCSPVRKGATAEIVKLVSEQLSNKYSVKSICIDDYVFAFCRGCRSCHNMAKCVLTIEYKADVESRKQEILDFCKCI